MGLHIGPGVRGSRRRGGASSRAKQTKAQLLTSLAAALLDPLWVCDVVVTSFAVEKCSKSDAWTAFRSRQSARRARQAVSVAAGRITSSLLWRRWR